MEAIAVDAGEASAATGVSTVGDNVGAGAAGTSPGLAGLPAARAGFVVSIAASAGVATAKAKVSLLDSFAGLPFAAATAGIGLGSIAGLDDSACPDDITAAASVAAGAVGALVSSNARAR